MNIEAIILELASFIRTLDFIKEGQAFIKAKLTDRLEVSQDLTIVNWAEDIHQQILNRELAIQLLKKDVQHLDRALNLLSGKKGMDEEKLDKFKKYKDQVAYLEQEFLLWKNKVNSYLELSGTSAS